MNSDDPFDREVRDALEGMAREPAPGRLVTRVAAIPDVDSAGDRGRPPFRGVISGLAAIAAVVALAVAAVVLRPGALPQTGDASAPPTQGVPSIGPTPVPSNPVATLLPTTAPTSTPTPTPRPTPQPLAGDPVPAGFRPISVTFVSTEQGWVLGSVSCATGRCAAIAHTVDGGKTWLSLPAPTTTLGTTGRYHEGATGVAGLRFADAHDGWAFGPDLWATHDGGLTWKRVAFPLAGAAVLELASSRGTVHAVAYDTVGSTDFRVASAAVGGGSWTISGLSVPVGGGPVPDIQLVLSGSAGWVLENDRTVEAGARLVAGTWRAWDPPCLDAVGPAYIAASSATELIGACDVGVMDVPQGGHLYVSHDGGVTFAETGPKMPFALQPDVAASSVRNLFAGGGDGHTTFVEGSFDGGHTWAPVHDAGSVGLTELGFTTVDQGVVVATTASGSSHLLMTYDGGHTWAAVHF